MLGDVRYCCKPDWRFETPEISKNLSRMVMYMLYVAYEVQQNSVVMHSLHGFVGKHHGPTWYGMLLCYFCIMDS